MTISLAGLDMPVLVPAGVPTRSLRVLATGLGNVAGTTLTYWEDVSIGPGSRPGADPHAATPWSVRTIARRGCRPGGDGGWTVDGSLRGVAETAVTSMLLKLVPYGLPAAETLRCTEQAGATGRAVAARLDDTGTWTRTTMDVDGHPFLLWLHQRPEGFAAVGDLGACRVVLHGLRPPLAWRFTLLRPEVAQAALGS
ncbi:hypothetical protein [Modestobacter versicolor]|uniref:Uncharacterized protein n=1 Tax=Modestobacter versicolor TaxID=429133 RepID=A0A323VCG3_9ACTN|nr:hypothetical protein [Modestobacter versicolor]MBB3678288.1 hypothetical protein [Modestobacter versicolor]PZA22395.1 hypothetical protein DMO24_05265 [Modestobacter versicolor]